MDLIEKFESKFADFTNTKYAISFSFGRNALYCLLKALDLKKDDEVIIPAFTCSSIPSTVRQIAKPVLVDVNDTFTIDENKIKKAITNKTKAIIVIHTYGNPAKIDAIKEICTKNNITLIEDIAHAMGSKYKKKLLGSYGDFSLYSLTKQTFNFGGGLITAKNKDYAIRIKKCREKLNKKAKLHFKKIYYLPSRFITSFWDSRASSLSKLFIDSVSRIMGLFSNQPVVDSALFPSFKLSPMEAKIALKQLKHLNKDNEKRKKYGNLFRKMFQKNKIQKILPEADPVFSYFVVILNNKQKKLLSKKIKFSRPWSCYHNRKEFINYYGNKKFPYTENLSKNLILIPVSPFYRENKIAKLSTFPK